MRTSQLLKAARRFRDRHLPRLLSLYPPYLGAGVQVVEASDDFRRLRVQMPLRFYNQNYVGTHFGGSLYSMCDPFFMLMLIQNLGPDYIVWDKAASIRFRRPGRGVVEATFELTDDQIEAIRQAADEQGKVEPELHVDIVDADGEVVAEVDKTLYVRRKNQ